MERITLHGIAPELAAVKNKDLPAKPRFFHMRAALVSTHTERVIWEG
jgi:hypothetical protein